MKPQQVSKDATLFYTKKGLVPWLQDTPGLPGCQACLCAQPGSAEPRLKGRDDPALSSSISIPVVGKATQAQAH